MSGGTGTIGERKDYDPKMFGEVLYDDGTEAFGIDLETKEGHLFGSTLTDVMYEDDSKRITLLTRTDLGPEETRKILKMKGETGGGRQFYEWIDDVLLKNLKRIKVEVDEEGIYSHLKLPS